MSTTPDSIGPGGQLPLSPDFEPLDHQSNSTNTTPTSQKMEEFDQDQEKNAPEAAALFREESAPPSALEPFDWNEFTARYEAALKDATEEEKAILKEAESLSRVIKPLKRVVYFIQITNIVYSDSTLERGHQRPHLMMTNAPPRGSRRANALSISPKRRWPRNRSIVSLLTYQALNRLEISISYFATFFLASIAPCERVC